MKKIEFRNILSPEGNSLKTDMNRWRVAIGRKTEISFKNQKHAISFQVKINEELNDALFTFNDVSIELYRHYRTAWFYFNSHSDHFANERAIRESFSEVDRLLDRVVNEYDHCRIIANLTSISEHLTSIAKSLQPLLRRRESYAEVRSLELIISRIHKCFVTVDELGWNPLPPGGEIVRCEPYQRLKEKEQRKKLEETLHRRSLKD